MTQLSIVIPNYNYGHFADRFFRSISSQSMSLNDVEIIYVDDGSSDDSLEQARKWSCKIDCSDFRILTPARSGKPGPVRNIGLEAAKGQYLVCIDPDDELRPEYLQECVLFLDVNPNITVVYTDYLEVSSEGAVEYVLPEFKPVHLRTQNTVAPAAVYRRELWESGVRYRDNTAYEDWGFWIQCLMAGARFQRLPQFLYIHHVHGSNFSGRAVREDGAAKANIVLNNAAFFHPVVQRWARDFLRGRLYAPPFTRGYIPTAEDIKKVMMMIESGEV